MVGKTIKNLLLVVLTPLAIGLISGCALAPLTAGYTGRSLDSGEIRVDAQFSRYTKETGAPVVTPSVKASYGITKDLDVGIQTESRTFTGLVKYSMLNSGDRDGLSLATMGAFVVMGSEVSYYFGSAISYLFKKFEPYFVYRYNIAHLDREFLNTIFFFETPPPEDFNFSSFTFGLYYWWTKTFGTGTEILLVTNTEDVKFNQSHVLNFQVSILF